MTKIDNGGPAFPMPRVLKHTGDLTDGCYGMTLRDWFAGQALAGISSGHDRDGRWSWEANAAAREAYRIADAMLAARKHPPSVEI